MQFLFLTITGGVATLNHRLPAHKPPACLESMLHGPADVYNNEAVGLGYDDEPLVHADSRLA
jgi:hypothetical protein